MSQRFDLLQNHASLKFCINFDNEIDKTRIQFRQRASKIDM